MCELAYPVREGTSEESSENSLAQMLDACAETLERLGTKMSGATAHDMTELAMLHTAAKTLVLRCRPNTTINPMWTNDRVSSNRGVLDTCWLTLLARRCHSHELVTRRYVYFNHCIWAISMTSCFCSQREPKLKPPRQPRGRRVNDWRRYGGYGGSHEAPGNPNVNPNDDA